MEVVLSHIGVMFKSHGELIYPTQHTSCLLSLDTINLCIQDNAFIDYHWYKL